MLKVINQKSHKLAYSSQNQMLAQRHSRDITYCTGILLLLEIRSLELQIFADSAEIIELTF